MEMEAERSQQGAESGESCQAQKRAGTGGHTHTHTHTHIDQPDRHTRLEPLGFGAMDIRDIAPCWAWDSWYILYFEPEHRISGHDKGVACC